MKILIILLLACIGLIVVAIQNTVLTRFSFLFWHITTSLSLIVIMAFLLGLAVGLLLTIPNLVGKTFKIAGQQKNLNKLNKDADKSTS